MGYVTSSILLTAKRWKTKSYEVSLSIRGRTTWTFQEMLKEKPSEGDSTGRTHHPLVQTLWSHHPATLVSGQVAPDRGHMQRTPMSPPLSGSTSLHGLGKPYDFSASAPWGISWRMILFLPFLGRLIIYNNICKALQRWEMPSIIITHISRRTRASSPLYKLPREQSENIKTASESKRWRRRSARFPVQRIQSQAGLAPQHSELHQYCQNNGNNQRYLLVLEVCPSFPWEADRLLDRSEWWHPKQPVTSKATKGIHQGGENFLHKRWYIIEKSKKIGVLLHTLLPMHLPPPHLHRPHWQTPPKGQENLFDASKRSCKYSHDLCLLISAHSFS